MGLLIKSFKKNGVEFTDAYAKVAQVNYDNDTKTASFSVSVYPKKDDNNLITNIQGLWVLATTDVDIVKQCYERIGVSILNIKNKIADLEAQIEATPEDDNNRYSLLQMVENLKKVELLQLDQAVQW